MFFYGIDAKLFHIRTSLIPIMSKVKTHDKFGDRFASWNQGPIGRVFLFFEQSRQKLGTFLENKIIQKSNFSKNFHS